jgi:crotonobetainyl-CoA:carnitine CoA-transferase CaiB-like acyl-CoA transferase
VEFAGSEVRQAVDHPITGPTKLVATPWTINGKRSTVRKPSPMIGADNDYVMHDILGYTSEKIASIHSSGVVDEVKPN